MGVALKQLAASVPQAGQVKIEDFLDRSLVSELEREGFLENLRRPLKKSDNQHNRRVPISNVIRRLSQA